MALTWAQQALIDYYKNAAEETAAFNNTVTGGLQTSLQSTSNNSTVNTRSFTDLSDSQKELIEKYNPTKTASEISNSNKVEGTFGTFTVGQQNLIEKYRPAEKDDTKFSLASALETVKSITDRNYAIQTAGTVNENTFEGMLSNDYKAQVAAAEDAFNQLSPSEKISQLTAELETVKQEAYGYQAENSANARARGLVQRTDQQTIDNTVAEYNQRQTELENQIKELKGETDTPDISFGERVGNTLLGAGEQWLGSLTNAAAPLYSVFQGARSSATNEELASLTEERERAQARYDEYIAAGDPYSAQVEQNIMDSLDLKIDAYGQTEAAQIGAVTETEKLADELSASGSENITSAKEGLGTVGQFGVDVGVGAAQLLGDIATGAVLGGGALLPMAARSFGGGAQEARQEGGNLTSQLAYGGASAATSLLVEKLSNASTPLKNAFGPGFVDSAINKALGEFGETAVGALVKSAGGEGLEEVIEAVIDPALQRLTYNPEADWDLQDIIYQGLVGATIGGLSGTGDVVQSLNANKANQAQQDAATAGVADEVDGGIMELLKTYESDQTAQTAEPVAKNANPITENANSVAENASPITENAETAVAEVTSPLVADGAVALAVEQVQSGQVFGSSMANKLLANADAVAELQSLGVDLSGTKSQQRAAVVNAVQDLAGGNSDVDTDIDTNITDNVVNDSDIDTNTAQVSMVSETKKNVDDANNGVSAENAVFNNENDVISDAVETETADSGSSSLSDYFPNMAVITPQEFRQAAATYGDALTEMAKQAIVDGTYTIDENGFRKVDANGQSKQDGSGARQWSDYLGSSPDNRSARQQRQSALDSRRQGETAETRRNDESVRAVAPTSSAQLGIVNGTDTKDVRILPDNLLTEGETTLKNQMALDGLQVKYVVGDMTDTNGKSIRGFVGANGADLYVRADHPTISAEQLLKHEWFHANKDRVELREQTLQQVKRDFSPAELTEMVDRYNAAYNTSMDADYIIDEILADAYAEIDIFAGIDQEGATKFSESVKRKTDNRAKTAESQETETKPLEKAEWEQRHSEDIQGVAALRKANKELQARVEYLAEQVAVNRKNVALPSDIRRLARNLAKEYNVKSAVAKEIGLESDLDAFASYLMSDDVDGLTVREMSNDIARKIVENAEIEIKPEEFLSDVKKDIRTRKIQFSSKSDIADWNSFRKQYFGRLNITDGGTPVDMVYADLAATYGEGLFPLDVMNPTDQILHLAAFVDKVQSQFENPYSLNMVMARYNISNDIIDRVIMDVDSTTASVASETKKYVEQAQKSIAKEKESRLKEVEELKDKFQTQREKEASNRARGKLRSDIYKTLKSFQTKLDKPNNQSHIPQEMREPIMQVMTTINQESRREIDPITRRISNKDNAVATKRTEAFQAMRDAYNQMISTNDYVVDQDLLGDSENSGLFQDVLDLNGIKIDEMTVQELRTVKKLLTAVNHAVEVNNQMLSGAHSERVSDFGDGVISHMQTLGNKQEWVKFAEKLRDLATLDTLKPVDFLHMLGDKGDKLWNYLRSGQNQYINTIKTAKEDVRTMLKNAKDVDVKNLVGADATVHKATTEDGKDIQFTTAQAMEVAVLMSRQQALVHMLSGGVRLGDIYRGDTKKAIKQAKPVKMTLNDLQSIVSVLSADEVILARDMSRYLSEVAAKWGNEAAMKAFGYEKFGESNYWPIKSDSNFTNHKTGKVENPIGVKDRSFTHKTIKGAKNAVVIGSAFDTFANHINGMATYQAYLLPTMDMGRIYNYQQFEQAENVDGYLVNMPTGNSFRSEVEATMGKRAVEYYDRLQENVNEGVKTKDKGFFDWTTGLYKGAAVGANLRTAAQQPTALLRAASVINPKYLAAAGKLNSNAKWDTVTEYSAIAQWKDWGFFDLDVGPQLQELLLDTTTPLNKIKEAGMTLNGKMDELAWMQLWYATEAELNDKQKKVEQSKRLEKNSPEYYEAVAKRFDEIVDRTQVVDGILQRSHISRSTNAFTKSATSFMSEPITSHSSTLRAFYDVRVASKNGEKWVDASTKKLLLVIMGTVAAEMAATFAASMVDAVRSGGADDDDPYETYWNRVLEAYFGNWENGFFEGFLSSNLLMGLNPLSKIPYVSDIMSLLEGYDIERMDMSVASDVITAWDSVLSAVQGKGSKTVGFALTNALTQTSKVGGWWAYNVQRDVIAIADMFLIETGSWETLYQFASTRIKPMSSKSTYYDMAYQAKMDDEDKYNALVEMMLDDGFEQSAIDSAMVSRERDALREGEAYLDIVEDMDKANTEQLTASDYYQSLDEVTQAELMEELTDYFDDVALNQLAEEDNSLTNWQQNVEESDLEPWQALVAKNEVGEIEDYWKAQEEENDKSSVEANNASFDAVSGYDMDDYNKVQLMGTFESDSKVLKYSVLVDQFEVSWDAMAEFEKTMNLELYEKTATESEEKTQEIVTRVLKAMDLDKNTKAALYQAYSVGWSSENNPFSVAVGNKVKTAITVTDDEK